MLISYKLGQGSIVLRVKIRNSSVSTGAGLTGLTSASSGLIISTIADNEASATAYTVAGSTIETITTLGTYAAPTATKCRFKEVDSTNHKGIYEIQIADARFAVSSAKSVLISISGATNAAECDALVPLTSVDPYDPTAFGVSRLDAAVSSRMATYTQPTGFLAATFPSGTVASTTNITAGTITTTTNLTNLPSIPNNWLTAAGIAAAALNGKGDWGTATNLGTVLTRVTTALPPVAPDTATGLPTTSTLWKAAMQAPTVLHVMKTGNDANDGSFASPYLTLAAANTAAISNPGATIVVWPGTYAESTESTVDTGWTILRGTVIAPASGNVFWADTSGVEINGPGTLRPPAATAAILVTDDFTRVEDTNIDLGAAGSLAAQSNGNTPISFTNVNFLGINGTTTDPVNFFGSESGNLALISLRESSLHYHDVLSAGQMVTVGTGYPGFWSLALSVGSVGDAKGKVIGGGSTTITGTGVWSLDGSGNAIAPAATALSTATWTNARAANLDNLDLAVSSRAAPGAAMTLTSGERDSVADAHIARNIAGGSSTGRTVKDVYAAIRNKVAIVGTTMTVYATDDTTTLWTATLTTDGTAVPITTMDPA